jgi:hypothetical protein
MTVRFHLKIGMAEADFEGDAGFLKAEIPNLISQIVSSLSALPANVLEALPLMGDGTSGSAPSPGQSTNTIASLTDAKTGPDLALAAAAHLTLVKGQDRFSRKDLLAEMQAAATFYSQNYSSNLSKILNNLTRGKRLNLVGTNTFALPKAVRDEYGERLKGAV